MIETRRLLPQWLCTDQDGDQWDIDATCKEDAKRRLLKVAPNTTSAQYQQLN